MLLRPRYYLLVSLLALFGVLYLADIARTEEARFSKQWRDCLNKASGGDISMVQCNSVETERQDRELNRNYRALLKALEEEGDQKERRAEVIAVQRLWVSFRDGNCALYDDRSGGTIARLAVSSCVLEMTAARAAELKRLMPL